VNTNRSTIVRTAAATLVAATLTLAACGGGDDDASPSTEAAATVASGGDAASGAAITIQSFSFGGVSSVTVGTTVTVTNDDSVPHTVTADDGSFDTGTIQPGDSAQITLDAAGTFTYHCNIHGSMTGSITVTA
jgi:plastocyanin